MNSKARLFSVILLGILILPVFFNPPKSGNVLGANEKKETQVSANSQSNTGINVGSFFNQNSNNASSNSPQAIPQDSAVPEYKLKDISSGIRDIKKKDVSSSKELIGRVIWDANASNAVTSDKFSLGSGLKVTYNDKITNIVVSNTRILAPDVLMMVDQKTFTQLGGNLEKQTSIDVIVNTD